MVRWQGIVVGVVLLGSALLGVAQAQTRVDGYYRQNGTYVQPHMRSAPDSNPYNNWSYPGNTNPYTGQQATGRPETYLNNYYNPQPQPVAPTAQPFGNPGLPALRPFGR